MTDTATQEGSSKTRKQRTPMTPEHKSNLARGREQGRTVRAYLAAIEDHKPRRGRKVTQESLQNRLTKVNELLISETDQTKRVVLVQERLDIQNQLNRSENDNMLTELEKDFVAAAKPWAESKGVTYSAFREIGVEPRVLKAAGMERKAS